MSCSEPTDCAERDPIPTTSENAKTERAVLAFVFDEHPNRLTIPEVSLAMNAKPDGGFESGDAVERVIRDLVGAGLLRCESGYVVPTRAALYFHRLESD
jgi:hypothetical protein